MCADSDSVSHYTTLLIKGTVLVCCRDLRSKLCIVEKLAIYQYRQHRSCGGASVRPQQKHIITKWFRSEARYLKSVRERDVGELRAERTIEVKDCPSTRVCGKQESKLEPSVAGGSISFEDDQGLFNCTVSEGICYWEARRELEKAAA